MHPLLALALVVAAGIGVTRLSLPPLRVPAVLPFVLLGALLGPGLRVLDDAVLRALTPVTALGLGWIGALVGAQFRWRLVRRIPRGEAAAGLALAASVFLVTAAVAALLVRFVPSLGTAWRIPGIGALPAILTLGAIGTMATSTLGGPARRVTLVATGCGLLAVATVLAVYRAGGAGGTGGVSIGGGVVRLAGMAASGAAIGMLAIWLARLRDGTDGMEPRLEVVAVVLAGAGWGLATRLSPFIICAVAGALLASRAPAFASESVQRAPRLLPRWSFGVYGVLLILCGAIVKIPSWWLVPAALLLAIARVAARWALLRYGRRWPPLAVLPPPAALNGVGQSAAAVALALSFELAFRSAGGGAILATTLLSVLLAEAAASALAGAASHPAPLTAAPPRAEVT